MKVTFKTGDAVRMTEPYRSSRLLKNPNDLVASASSVTVETVFNDGFLLKIWGRPETWISGAFELAGGPW